VIVALITAPKRPNNFLGCWASSKERGQIKHDLGPMSTA